MAGKKTRVRIENPTAVGPFINAIHGWNEGSNVTLWAVRWPRRHRGATRGNHNHDVLCTGRAELIVD